MRKSISPLGDTELEILHHVWEMGEATVAEVQERIMQERKVAYTTVMTIMRNLNKKGYLDFEKKGVTYHYRPAQSADTVKQNLVSTFVNKVFKGNAGALVQNLVEAENISSQDRKQIEDIIRKMDK